MHKTIIVLSLFLSTNIFADPLWEDVDTFSQASAKQLNSSLSSAPASYTARHLLLDEVALRHKLSPNINHKSAKRLINQEQIFNLPLPDGSMLAVIAKEYSMMQKTLSERFPQFKTWKVRAANGKNIRGRIDFTSVGFHAMLILENGDTVFIDPNMSISANEIEIEIEQGKRPYNSFSKQKNKHLFQRSSPIKEIIIQPQKKNTPTALKPQARPAKALITYKLALAATAEYSALHGKTKEQAFGAMFSTINRVNDIYERDLSIRLQLTDTDKLIYLNPSTDPYTNGNPYKMMDENRINIDAVVGSANYDIGHLFGGDGTGGLALLSSVCRSNIGAHKAAGVTGSASPYGDTFDIDYVAHEIGHQFGATHTFNSLKDSCGGGNREASSAAEPGSGSTIMSYAGICAGDNLQSSSDAVFHAISIGQINHYTRHSGEAKCGVQSDTDNNDPTLSTTQRHHIPINTPFLLTANGNDSDIGIVGKNDSLTYTWDQIDIDGTAVQVGIDAGDNPLFRSYMPTSSNQRYFPQLATLFGNFPIDGETPSLTSRELNFTTSVRDGQGGIALTNTKIITSGSKPFKITSQTGSDQYHIAEDIDVRWNEAGTSWAPINCNYVDIKLLTKDGATQGLLKTTQNDGAETIIIPNTINAVSDARIMVACSDNIFFALSKGEISIDNTIKEESQLPIATINSPSIIEGDLDSKTLNYIVTLAAASNEAGSISYIITDAKNNNQIQTDTIYIPQGETSATISQIIEGNVTKEEDKHYSLTLFSPQNIQFSSAGNLTTTGTVIDNDNDIIRSPVSITVNDISVVEGNVGVTKATFTINLDHIATTHTFVDYATLADSAQIDDDFTPRKGTLLISSGEKSGTVSIDITADKHVEDDEIFWLLLTNSSNNTLLTSKTATAIILNDDQEEKVEVIADKEIDTEDSAGGSFDSILTFFLIYISLLRLRFRARQFNKARDSL